MFQCFLDPGIPADRFRHGLLVTVGFIDPGNWASNLTITCRFLHSLDLNVHL